MDINVVRITVTLATFAAFLLILWWAYAPKRRAALNQEARRILEDDQ